MDDLIKNQRARLLWYNKLAKNWYGEKRERPRDFKVNHMAKQEERSMSKHAVDGYGPMARRRSSSQSSKRTPSRLCDAVGAMTKRKVVCCFASFKSNTFVIKVSPPPAIRWLR